MKLIQIKVFGLLLDKTQSKALLIGLSQFDFETYHLYSGLGYDFDIENQGDDSEEMVTILELNFNGNENGARHFIEKVIDYIRSIYLVKADDFLCTITDLEGITSFN